MLQCDEGIMTLDFLFGFMVFLAAFLYVVMMVPGLFMPYQNNVVDLSSVAYRTSALLVEDPGFYQAASTNGTDWENHLTDLKRVGLASEKSTPGVISKVKLMGLATLNHTASSNKMGLNNTIPYDYYLTITWINNSSMPVFDKDIVNGVPPTSQNVETIQRSVLVEEGKGVIADGSNIGDLYQIDVKVTKNDIKKGNIIDNVTLTILNAPSGGKISLGPLIDGFATSGYGHDRAYVIYINKTESITGPPIVVNVGSRIDIVMNGTNIVNNYLNGPPNATITYITDMQIFDSSKVNPSVPYNETSPLFGSVYDKAILNLQVWS